MSTAMSVPGAVPQWTLGDRLTKARQHAGLKQDQLGERLGVSRFTVIRWETDERVPNMATLMAYAMVTGVDLDWLLGATPRRRRRRASVDSNGYLDWPSGRIETAA